MIFFGVDMTSAGAFGLRRHYCRKGLARLGSFSIFTNWQKIGLPAYTPFFSFQESENIQNDTKLAKNLNVFAKNGHFFGLFQLGGVGPSRLGAPFCRDVLPPYSQKKTPRGKPLGMCMKKTFFFFSAFHCCFYLGKNYAESLQQSAFSSFMNASQYQLATFIKSASKSKSAGASVQNPS